MANDYDKGNPFFNTDFAAYNENLKWQNENNFNNQQAWDARLYATWEREQTQAWNEKMYERALEDNSIGAQIDRARAAGVSASAIVGGDYRSAQASAPTSSPQSPVQSHGGTSDAARTSAIMDGIGTIFNSAKGFADNLLQREQIQLNKKQIDSQVNLNATQMAALLAGAGVDGATEEQIRQSLKWIDPLNEAGLAQKMAEITKVHNEIAIEYERLGLDYREVSVSEYLAKKNGQLIDAETALKEQQTQNAKLEELIQTNQAEILELQAKELTARLKIGDITGIPVGTDPYHFIYALQRQGKLQEYVEHALVPFSRGQMSPQEFLQVYQENYGGAVEGHAGLGVGKGGVGVSAGASGHVTYTTEKQHSVSPYGYGTPPPDNSTANPSFTDDDLMREMTDEQLKATLELLGDSPEAEAVKQELARRAKSANKSKKSKKKKK